jgi:hypothetical protein
VERTIVIGARRLRQTNVSACFAPRALWVVEEGGVLDGGATSLWGVDMRVIRD